MNHHRTTIRRISWIRRAALAIVVMSGAAIFPPASSVGAQEAEPGEPGFRRVGEIATGTRALAENSLLLDHVHRRAYGYRDFNASGEVGLEFRVFDLDAVGTDQPVERPPLRITRNTNDPNDPANDIGPTGGNEELAGSEAVMDIDESRGRLFYVSGGAIYEVDAETYDPETNRAPVHVWIATPVGGEEAANELTGQNIQGGDTAVGSVNGTAIDAFGIEYDPGGSSPDGEAEHPERVFTVGEAPNETQSENSHRGVVIQAWDATPGTGDFRDPEQRLEWTYTPTSCTSLARRSTNEEMKLESPVFRSGDWLYTFCDQTDDGSTLGLMRVHLEGSPPAPNAATEQFYPGVTGRRPHVEVDRVRGRVYVSTTNPVVQSRSVLAFDDEAGDGQGAYIGEVALSRSQAPTASVLDPGTGRVFYRTLDGLWYQDGRLRRVSQAVLFQEDIDGNPLAQPAGDLDWRRLYIDPAVPGERGARILVWQRSKDYCAGDEACYLVYEDTSPQPGDPPPPDERTLNEPEGEGKVGVYTGVVSAYGARLRIMRGLSTLWPSQIPFLRGAGTLEAPPSNSPPANPLTDYRTDPFFYHAGECGAKDREFTFARVHQSSLGGGLFSQSSDAEAIALDPDVRRPSAQPDTQTRHDVSNPDECSVGLLAAMTNIVCRPPAPQGGEEFQEQWEENCDPPRDAFWEGVGQAVNAMGREWAYPFARCDGDGSDGHASSFFDAESTQGPVSGTSDVTCAARADEPFTEASASATTPFENPLVTVQDTDTETRVARRPGEGILVEATSTVEGVSIMGGAVEIEQIVTQATSVAEGYATEEGSTAQITFEREFLGLTVAGVRRCDVCDAETVVDAVDFALGSAGYARAADPEPDYTLGTEKGTLAVVQKDLVLQDADATTNRDFSSEWAGLEIVIFRDGQLRGRGRWSLQLGGVFTQAQFGVINELAPLPDLEIDDGGGDSGVATGTVIPAVEPTVVEPETVTVAVDSKKAARAAPTTRGGERIIDRIKDGLERSLGAALLMGALWSLVYGPVYLARRRKLLKQLSAT